MIEVSNRRLIVLTLAAMLVLALAPAGAVQQYTMTDLGTLGTDSYAYGVNSVGQVVGHSRVGSTDHAYLYTPGVGMVDLFPSGSYSYAFGINDSGQITGFARIGGFYQAYIYSTAAGVTYLGTLGGYYSYAYGINDAGQITGRASATTAIPPVDPAFLYTPGIGMVSVGYLGNNYAEGRGVNSFGHVAGWSYASGSQHAFLYKPSTGMVDLGALLGVGTSQAWGINDAGVVVGVYDNEGFVWQEGIGKIMPFGSNSQARAINNAGQVVGWNGPTSGVHAFTWTSAHGVTDLGTLGGTASTAFAVSSNGLIAGSSKLSDGSVHAALWTPVPEPGSILILASGLIGILFLRRRSS